MTRKTLLFGLVVATVACSNPQRTTPLSPTASLVDVAALNPDGSSLKFNAPTGLNPNGGTLDTLRPVFTWNNATGQYASVGVSYDFEAQNAAGNVVYFVEALGEINNHQITFELPYATTFWWRVRARRFADVGPWSGFAQIRTPEPPPPPPPPPTQPPGGGGSGLPFPIPEACGPFGVGNRIACAAAVAGQSAEWAGCLAGIGVFCHRFTRQVAFALGSSDPAWTLIMAAPGGHACNCNDCGPSDGTMFREDTVVYNGNRVFDMIVGAGGPFPSLNWTEVPGPRPGDLPVSAPLCR